jgi:hypothetical protein
MDTFARSFPGWAVDDVAVQAGAATASGAPTGLAATAGNAQVSLAWAAPASNGGSAITSNRVYRGTASGAETLLTAGGCSGLGAVLSCTDAGLTNGQAYFYKVSAVNSAGESAQSNEASATPTSTPTQLIGNPGFENGSTNPAPWVGTSGVIGSPAGEPLHSGSWDAWLDGYGTTHTDTLYQQVTIPSNISTANLGFWLHIDTAETSSTTAYDTLQVQVRNPSGSVLGTLATYSNLDAASGYTQKTFDLSAYKGQTIQIYLLGQEDSTAQTSFVVDDFALNGQ